MGIKSAKLKNKIRFRVRGFPNCLDVGKGYKLPCIYEIYQKIIYIQNNELDEAFFETARGSRRATGTSTKVAGEYVVK